ncbi:MAG: hypothetical protein ABSG53_20960 [Thermoguttaceae bacterium]
MVYTPIAETKYTVDGIWDTYGTPVTRTTVDEFCPGFSAFGVPLRSMHIAVRPNTAFRYVLFCGILIDGQEIAPIFHALR